MSLATLTSRFASDGEVRWIGLRPARREAMILVESAAVTLNGLTGDRRDHPGKRAVSLIQWEHLDVIAALAAREDLTPDLLRRNIAVSGINLLGLRKRRFRIGAVLLQGTGLCAPCSRMEETLGPGGYTAMRGHGGITAEVIEPGEIVLGDTLKPMGDEGFA
ncbi:MAG: MOSC domain-containing protein [Pseudomonadota bacterium]